MLAASIRPTLLQWVLNGTSTVVNFQKRCGVVPTSEGIKSNVQIHKNRLSDSDKGNESDEDKSDKVPDIKTGTRVQGGAEPKKPSKVYGVPTNRVLHWIFACGTTAGHEIFYIFLLPFVYWNVNHIVSRRSVLVWFLCYYIGQACKDWLRLPRPPSPPVLRLSNFYEAEFGLPSTHAMGAVAISFSLVLSTYHVGYDISLPIWISLALLYTSIVCLSRIYMGAHTVADIVAGLILSFGLVVLFLLVGEPVDAWLATSPWVPIVVPAIAVALLYIYPAPRIWSESFGDTATFLAVGTGILVGHWTVGTPMLVPGMAPQSLGITSSNIGRHLLRCLIGYLIIGGARSVIKQICLFILPRLILSPENEYAYNDRLDSEPEVSSTTTPTTTTATTTKGNAKQRMYSKYFWTGYNQNYAIEIPTKLVTYSCLGYFGFYTEPLCDYFGLTL